MCLSSLYNSKSANIFLQVFHLSQWRGGRIYVSQFKQHRNIDLGKSCSLDGFDILPGNTCSSTGMKTEHKYRCIHRLFCLYSPLLLQESIHNYDFFQWAQSKELIMIKFTFTSNNFHFTKAERCKVYVPVRPYGSSQHSLNTDVSPTGNIWTV